MLLLVHEASVEIASIRAVGLGAASRRQRRSPRLHAHSLFPGRLLGQVTQPVLTRIWFGLRRNRAGGGAARGQEFLATPRQRECVVKWASAFLRETLA